MVSRSVSRNSVVHLTRNVQRGSALLSVVMFSSILLVAVTVSSSSVMYQMRASDRTLKFQQAITLAEAGAEAAMAEFGKTSNQWASWNFSGGAYTLTDTLTAPDGSAIGSFTTSVTGVGSGEAVIQSTGNAGGTNPAIRTVRISLDEGESRSPFGEFGLFSYGTVNTNNNTLVNSYNSATAPYGGTNIGSNGNVGSIGVTTLSGATTIKGSVQAGGNISKGGQVQVSGSIVPRSAPTPPPPFPTDAFNAAANNNNNSNIYIKNNDGTGQPSYPTRAGGFNGNLVSGGPNKTVYFPAPANTRTVYYLTSIQLNNDCHIVNDGPGEVVVYLTGTSATNSVAVNMPNGNSLNVPRDVNGDGVINQNDNRPNNFWLFVQKGSVTFNNANSMYLGLYAPNSTTYIASSGGFYGAAVTGNVTLNSGNHFHYDESMGLTVGGGGAFVQWWTEVMPQRAS